MCSHSLTPPKHTHTHLKPCYESLSCRLSSGILTTAEHAAPSLYSSKPLLSHVGGRNTQENLPICEVQQHRRDNGQKNVIHARAEQRNLPSNRRKENNRHPTKVFRWDEHEAIFHNHGAKRPETFPTDETIRKCCLSTHLRTY